MLEPTASRFWQAAIQSALVDDRVLRACWDAIPADKREPEHIDRRLARRAVQSGVLTLWQAQQLITGRSTGFKIDRYVLLQLIGQGGMGRVYLALDSRLNRRVAVKILSPERVNNPRAIARFHREALVGAQLQHENLVRIYDEGEANGRCYLVMEYIEGKNIGQMISGEGPIPPAVAARLARQVALGLEHAQRKGLIHRDVNPFNILVTRDGAAKLTDLGLAIDLAEQDRVTRDGATVGTFDYVSPEQARHSHSVDTRSDIYSLGCSLYHMLSGRVPFPSASLAEKLFGHQVSEPEPLLDLVPGIPAGLAAVVSRTMRKSPDERYATPLELAQALEPYAADDATADPGPATRPAAQAAPALTAQAAPERPAAEAPADAEEPAAAVSPSTPASISYPAISAVPPRIPGPAPPLATMPDPGPALPTPAPASADDDLLGLNLSLDLGPEPPLSRAAKAKAKPKSKPAPGPKPTAGGAAPGPVLPGSDLDPALFGQAEPASPAPADDGLLGLNLSLDLGPEPPLSRAAKPKAKPAPAPKPTAGGTAPGPVAAGPDADPAPFGEAEPASPAPADDGLLGLNLSVDLGPEAPLSRTAPAAKPKPKPKPAPGPKPEGGSGGTSKWVVPAMAVAALIVILAGGALAFRGWSGGGAAAAAKGTGAKEKAVVKATAGGKFRPVPVRPKEPLPRGKEVVVIEGDGTRSIEPDLLNGMRAAIGSRGYVLLLNDEPMVVPAAGAIKVSGGSLVIRAGDGARPVLRVEVKGGKPFLTTGSDTALRIEGVSIVARYVDPGPNPGPVIAAGAGVTLDRCAFRVEGQVPGARAVTTEGGAVAATGCWFENFDRAIDVACFGGTTATLRHCMLIHPRADDPKAPAAAGRGWAVRMRGMPGGSDQKGRRLVVDHCTARGAGLLDSTGFSPQSPLAVDLTACAVLTDALVSWQPGTPAPGEKDVSPLKGRGALTWEGRGNQYDVRGKSWVMLAPAKGAPEAPLPDGPADLDSWTKRIGHEVDPVPPPIRFATDPAALSAEPRPADFAVTGQGVRSVGADPAHVGPGARPVPASSRKF